jgi:hypothetical protein
MSMLVAVSRNMWSGSMEEMGRPPSACQVERRAGSALKSFKSATTGERVLDSSRRQRHVLMGVVWRLAGILRLILERDRFRALCKGRAHN